MAGGRGTFVFPRPRPRRSGAVSARRCPHGRLPAGGSEIAAADPRPEAIGRPRHRAKCFPAGALVAVRKSLPSMISAVIVRMPLLPPDRRAARSVAGIRAGARTGWNPT
ncbi:hypothetical protein GCM10025331_50310 [Actinoplanes utahensis]|nr:hypothetical protein Aut01nite_64590 [Actinoplanes utahensis]